MVNVKKGTAEERYESAWFMEAFNKSSKKCP